MIQALAGEGVHDRRSQGDTIRDPEVHVLRRYLESNGAWISRRDDTRGSSGVFPRGSGPETARLFAHSRVVVDPLHARYYSHTTGRLLSVDPEDGKVGLSQSWNRYAYVRGDPVSAVDSDGRTGKEVADWIDRKVAAVVQYVDAHTGGDVGGVLANAAGGTVGDLVSGTADMLRVGDSVGEAIGEGESGEDLVVAVSKDVGRASALALTMAVPARMAVRSQILPSGEVMSKVAKERLTPGQDGATSRHMIETADGETVSVTHQVEKDGTVIHQHQTHIGKHGTRRVFPDDWVENQTIPPEER